jgi:hypothetical protein
MDWSHPVTAAIYYVALGVFITLCFFLQVGIHALRDKIALQRTTTSDIETTHADDDLEKSEFKPFESSIESQITFGGASSTDHLTK